MKKLMFLVCIVSTGLSAVSPATSPANSPVKKKDDRAIQIVREEIFKQKEQQGADRKQARKAVRAIVRQLKYENDLR